MFEIAPLSRIMCLRGSGITPLYQIMCLRGSGITPLYQIMCLRGPELPHCLGLCVIVFEIERLLWIMCHKVFEMAPLPRMISPTLFFPNESQL